MPKFSVSWLRLVLVSDMYCQLFAHRYKDFAKILGGCQSLRTDRRILERQYASKLEQVLLGENAPTKK